MLRDCDSFLTVCNGVTATGTYKFDYFKQDHNPENPEKSVKIGFDS